MYFTRPQGSVRALQGLEDPRVYVTVGSWIRVDGCGLDSTGCWLLEACSLKP